MTVLERVKEFIEQQCTRPVCDDCIASRLGLSVRQHANHKTRQLAEIGGFDRRIDVCEICGNTKKVIKVK